jgi:hypothetical protein
MKASVIDLRYKMREVLKALDHNERVEILYHGKLKGILLPAIKGKNKKVSNHPFFGMNKDTSITVKQEMSRLRQNRYDNI